MSLNITAAALSALSADERDELAEAIVYRLADIRKGLRRRLCRQTDAGWVRIRNARHLTIRRNVGERLALRRVLSQVAALGE